MKHWRTLLPEILLLTLTASIALISSHSPFFYDDLRQIVRNSNLHDLRHLQDIFLSPDRQSRIVMNLIYALCWWISNGSSWSFHLVNIGFHLLNGLLLSTFLTRYFPKHRKLVLTTLALFLLHPIQVEAVAHIMSLPTLLEATFVLMALNLRARETETSRPWACLLPVVLLVAPFAKETGALLPLILLLFDFTLGAETWQNVRWKSKCRYLLSFLAPAIWLWGPSMLKSQEGVVGFSLYPFVQYFWTQMYYLPFRLWLLLNPAGQSFYHEYPDFTARVIIFGAVGFLIYWCLFTSIIFKLRRKPMFSFLFLFFIIVFAPYGSFLQYMNPFAEYRLYLSNIPLFVGISFLMTSLFSKIAVRARPALSALLVTTLLFFSVAEQKLWAVPMAKIAQSLSNYPRSWRLHLLLGEQLESHGRFAEAEAAYLTGERLNATLDPHPTLLPRILLIQLFENSHQWARALSALEALPREKMRNPPPVEYFQHYLYTLKNIGNQRRYDEIWNDGIHFYPSSILGNVPFRSTQ